MNESLAVVSQLVRDFKDQESYYTGPKYQEQEVRKDFIDKFFTALGWDVNHEKQKNPYKQEVKVERKPDSRTQRRADYAFYVAPNYRDVRFFVEAKKPSRNLHNADDYFQAIRYAWNAETPIVVLTDFEEFHLLDARIKPDIATVLDRKLKYFHYSQYADPETFAQIFHLFSRIAVEDGAIDDWVATLPTPKIRGTQGSLFPQTQTIGDAFLEELDEVRRSLAKAFKKRNPDWDGMLLTEATQRTIDRLVFMRFLEDKLIEADRIVAHLGDKHSIWQDFTGVCRRMNAKYNGIVFKEHFIDSPDCPGPEEKEFLSICQGLSHTNSPYDFNSIPVHILGSVYERFLGKVIVATPKRVEVLDKPEVKKAGGVTYTPQDIVRHLVERTVGELIEGKTPRQILAMRFIDIACGSGSFLITIFELLIEYCQVWYQEHPDEAQRDGCHFTESRWALSLKQKQAILLNCIYGVDIDPQAVEITQLSLYLKLLEDESLATANEMQVLFKEKILPDLSRNIVNGNSIIGSDIHSGHLFTEDEERTLLPLDFETVFPAVMRPAKGAPGFDVVVGNPPYVRQETLGKKVKQYLKEHYKVAHGIADLYTYFIERGVSLLRPGGRFGYIVANKWMRANYGEPLRKWMKQQCIEEISDFGDLPVFKTVTTYPCLLFIRKDAPDERFRVAQIKTLDYENLGDYINLNNYAVRQDSLDDNGWSLSDEKTQAILDKIKAAGVPLGEYVNGKIFYGIKTGFNEAFVIDSTTKEKLIEEDPKSEEVIKPFLFGRDIKRYESLSTEKWLIFTRRGIKIKNYPAIEKHLLQYKSSLMPRPKSWKGGEWKGRKPGSYKWYEIQDTVDYWEYFQENKIVYAEIATRGHFTLDSNQFYSETTSYIIPKYDLYFLAVLNSKLITYVFRTTSSEIRGGYLRWKRQYVSELPIKVCDLTNKLEKISHDVIVESVYQIMEAKSRLSTSISDRDKSHFTNKCNYLDREIDRLVYELYGLTEEEVRLMEGEGK